MSLLPKSIHRCRRYPTKFNSGRDIPVNLAIFGWLSQVYYAGILFVLPRLLRTQLYSERLAHVNWWL